MTNLPDLPNEILLQVFDYLTPGCIEFLEKWHNGRRVRYILLSSTATANVHPHYAISPQRIDILPVRSDSHRQATKADTLHPARRPRSLVLLSFLLQPLAPHHQRLQPPHFKPIRILQKVLQMANRPRTDPGRRTPSRKSPRSGRPHPARHCQHQNESRLSLRPLPMAPDKSPTLF